MDNLFEFQKEFIRQLEKAKGRIILVETNSDETVINIEFQKREEDYNLNEH